MQLCSPGVACDNRIGAALSQDIACNGCIGAALCLLQLSERMDLLRGCLERLQGRLQGCPPLLGDAAQLRERLRENGAAVAELQQMGAALQAVQEQCDELRDSMQQAGCNAAATGRAAMQGGNKPTYPCNIGVLWGFDAP